MKPKTLFRVFLVIALSVVTALGLQLYLSGNRSVPCAASGISGLKDLPIDTAVQISGNVVTYAPKNASQVRSTTHFYISDPAGSPAIRVADGQVTPYSISEDNIVNISGKIKKTAAGEAYILLDSAPGVTSNKTIKPVGVTTRALHTDKNLMAVLVKASGKVRQVVTNQKYFTITDGYTVGGQLIETKVIVENDQSLSVVAPDDMVSVTGVVSKDGINEATAKNAVLFKSIQVTQAEFPISGKVKSSQTGTGISGATVYLSKNPGAVANPLYTLTASSAGDFSKILTRGTWYIAASASGYVTSTEQTITIAKPGLTNFYITLAPLYTVSGKVTGVLGNALTGAQVYIGTTSNPISNPTYTLTTDASGNYSKTLTNGTWYIAATATDYANSTAQTVVVNGAAVPNVNFQLTPNVPRTTDLLFSALNTNFPASGSNVGNWSTAVPSGGLFYPIVTPKVDAVNGTKFASVTRAGTDGFRFRRDGSTEAYSTAIPIDGASIVTVIKPTRSGDTDNWKSIVDIFYDRLCLVTNNGTGVIGVRRGGTANWAAAGTAIPDGQTTVLSLIVQPDGKYKVYANGTQIMDITTTSAMTSLVPGVAGTYAVYINLGRNNPDGWSTYNGLIGDTYCYKVPLSDMDRRNLEYILTTKFRASSTTYTITASAGAGGTISPSGASTVCAEADKSYTITPNTGYGIQSVAVDGEPVGAVSTYKFNDVVANHTISVTFYQLPSAAVSGRVIDSSGTGIPGATVYFSPTANASVSPAYTFTTDASGNYSGSVPTGSWKVCASATGYNTSLDITFTVNGSALPDITLTASGRNIPQMDKLLFANVTDSFQDNNTGVPLLTGIWQCHHPKGLSMDVFNSPQVEMIGTMKWEKNVAGEYDGYKSPQYTTAIPCSGASVVAVVRPIRATTGTDYTAIASLLHDRVLLGIRNNTGEIVVFRNGTRVNTGVIVPEDQTILSMVVQPTGTFKVWMNGTQVVNNTTTSTMTSLTPYVTNASADRLQIGRSIDNASTFNGNIGDVFAYKVALTDAERQQLETDISNHFGPGVHAIAGKVTAVSGGAAIAGATVYFSQSPDPSANPTYTVLTDASGNYRKYIADGDWYVAAGASTYITSADRFVELAGATQSSVNFSLALIPTYAISGKVTDQNGTAISGAKVYIKSSPNAPVSPNYTLTTDASGNFSQAVVNGNWYVTAFAAGYSTPTEQTITVNGAAVPNVNFTLTIVPTFAVSGKVTNPSGTAISGATVYFSNIPNASASPVYTATTDSSGNYSKLIPNGTWYVAAGASTYSTSTDSTVVVDGAAVPNTDFVLYSQSVAGIKMGPYLQAVTENSVYVLAECDGPSPVMVEWGVTNSGYAEKSYTETTATTTASPVTYMHRVKLSGLEANTVYHYRISQGGQTPSVDYTFTTAAKSGTNFRFGFMADPRYDMTTHNLIAAKMKAAAPRFCLYGGDLCLDGTYSAFKSEWFTQPQLDLDAITPSFHTPGNHEGWGQNMKAFTYGPASSSGTQDYYSFDYGDCHFVMINNSVSCAVGGAQYNWAAADLAATNKPWKVVFFHSPAYCQGDHNEDPTMVTWSQNLFVPNKVDVVLAGHNHFYQHNYVSGIHHFVFGSAGAPLLDPSYGTYTMVTSKSYNYGVLDVTPTSFAVKAYNEAGTLLDTLNLTKTFVVSGKISNSVGIGIANAVVAAGGSYSNISPVVTDSSGNYSITLPGPGSYELYADAPGYSAGFGSASVTSSGTVTSNITLTSVAESGVYNGGFETANGGMPDGWESFIEKPAVVDYYGNAWPDKSDMYSIARSTTANTFASGAASAKIATAAALPAYGVLRIDRSTINANQSTGMTETSLTDSTVSYGTNAYAGGTWFAQVVHGGNDREILPTQFADFRIVSNTATTLTFGAGSNLLTNGYAVGDRYRFLREIRNYWYTGGIRTAPARRMAVDRSNVYNFYFKQKTSYTGTESEKCHTYALVWRDAVGTEISRNEWKWRPGTSFTQSTPRLFVSPPVGATTVEACIYTSCIDNANTAWSDTSYIDDVVIDPVPVTAVSTLSSLGNGAHVLLPANPASLTPRDISGERYTNYFYVSEPDGLAGTRVENQYARMDDLNVNDVVGVSGVVATTSAGEKYVKANITGAVTTGKGATPATMSVASALGDASALGKYVAVTASVSSIASDRSSFNITSGGSTIKVNSVGYPLAAGFASVGDSIRVNGVVSQEGSAHVILMMNYSKQTTAWPTNDVTWVAVSDVHYGAEWMTRALSKQRIAAINALPGTAYPTGVAGVVGEIRGVTITGDVTDNDNDKAAQFKELTMDYGLNGNNQLRVPVYEGLGNHDGGVTYPAADGMKPRNLFRPDLAGISADGLNYSWDWGRVHFVQMNEAGSYLNQDSLEWIKADLAANVATSGRPVVLLQHLGFDGWSLAFYSRGEAKKLYDAVCSYNVIAVLWGHTGGYDQYKWGGIDVFGCDGPMEQFHVFHITQTELIVTRRKWDNGTWLSWTFRKNITGM